MNPEPWYGVRLVYRLSEFDQQAYEERVIVIRASSDDEAIIQAEHLSKSYESDTTVYTGFALAFHIFDENGPCLGEGVEVFSLIRKSALDVDAYLDRFHDTGNECSRSIL